MKKLGLMNSKKLVIYVENNFVQMKINLKQTQS